MEMNLPAWRAGNFYPVPRFYVLRIEAMSKSVGLSRKPSVQETIRRSFIKKYPIV